MALSASCWNRGSLANPNPNRRVASHRFPSGRHQRPSAPVGYPVPLHMFKARGNSPALLRARGPQGLGSLTEWPAGVWCLFRMWPFPS